MFGGAPNLCREFVELAEAMNGSSEEARSSGTEVLDRISALPQNLLEDILSRLPLRDAVRTSVLSTTWREKWTTLPRIVFDESGLSGKALTKAIYTLFSFHKGPIQVFELHLSNGLPKNANVRRWIRRLSRRSINELKIDSFSSTDYNLGSCLFACQDLISLDLACCSFRLPSNFTGLKNLKNLVLRQAPVALSTLENLVSSCPQLVKLVIVLPFSSDFISINLKITAVNLQQLTVHGVSTLKIDVHAPNLEHLDLIWPEDINVNTSCLLSLKLAYFNGENVTYEKTDAMYRCLLKLFAQQSRLKYVDLHHYFIKYLSLSGFPDTLCNSLVHVKHLKLRINLSSVEDVSTTLCLLRSCSNLESFVINQEMHGKEKGNAYAVSKLLEENNSSCLFKQLKNVWVRWISDNEAETSFLKLVMSSSPILKNMVIRPELNFDVYELQRQLQQCPQSNQLQVFYMSRLDRSREPIEEPVYNPDEILS